MTYPAGSAQFSPHGAAAPPVPPHSFEAEQTVLGAILLNNKVVDMVADVLRPEFFADPFHARLYAACIDLFGRGHMVSPVVMAQRFVDDDDLREMGGNVYLISLVQAVVSVADARDYAKLIYDLHLRRELIALGQEMITAAQGGQGDAAGQMVEAEGRLFRLAESGAANTGLKPMADVSGRALTRIEAVYRADGALVGVSTGFADLDKLLGGLQGGELLILAGRPSMGKTALAVNMAVSAAESGRVVAVFSQEMADIQICDRILADKAQVAVHRVRGGRIYDAEFERLAQQSFDLRDLPLFIDDSAALTPGMIRARARRLKRRAGLGLVVVDYLQLMRADSAEAGRNRVGEISEITRMLKALARELDVPVVVLSQLSRAVESREDKRPQLSDLRESGAIEQDADTVMFVYREQYYLERAEPVQRADESGEKFSDRRCRWDDRFAEVAGTGEVIIAKSRQGPVGAVKLAFDGAFARFADLINSEATEGGL